MKNKKALALALASVTMAGAAALTTYSAITAPSVHAEEFVRKTEWITVANDSARTRTTVYFEAGDQKIDKHKYIDKYEYQSTYVEGGVRYYVFVLKGTKLAELENDPNTASADLNNKVIKSTDKRKIAGVKYQVIAISTQKEIQSKVGQSLITKHTTSIAKELWLVVSLKMSLNATI